MKRCAITLEEAGGANVCAFLDMLAGSEGTDNGRQKTMDRGYDVIVGGNLFMGYSDHPRVRVYIPRIKDYSTAAGRYQLLSRYYDAYRVSLRLLDFSPLNQDRIAIQQIRERRALPSVVAGHLDDAIHACANIWASLPGNNYGQHVQSMSYLRDKFTAAGGTIV